MHCVNCGYLLFNLTRPVCPECGRTFRVSDYRFEPGCVEYLCPSCLTPLEGGLPTADLARRPCAHCGVPLDPETLAVRPIGPHAVGILRDEDEESDLAPASRPAVWPVWKRVMALDGGIFRKRSLRSTGDAYWFAAWCIVVTGVAGGVLSLLASSLLMPGVPGPLVILFAISGAPVAVFMLVMAAIAGPLVCGGALAVWTHLALALLEPTCRPFTHTFRAACYAVAPVVLAGVPIVGVFVAAPYTVLTFIVGVRTVHETSTLVAIVSALWLPVVLTAWIVLM
ncbi:MAG: hypothetical protein JXB13_06710 [Phycisphaerae bacterium]|nr:hypothetical protein [Phycisphaerae bacterium]